ncbi:hypothetical protein PY32053_01479 [Paracoccus yeei]|uniref:Uncharacterized protein n=1 Tax=Paracoccus yeei TaxID=147645 RepID=A0A386ULC2_9RHOB|nr:hypothetical protein PY32053_01479 [Paracoccus yeei]
MPRGWGSQRRARASIRSGSGRRVMNHAETGSRAPKVIQIKAITKSP